MLERAARYGDPIEHSFSVLGGLTGVLIGLGIGIAIVAGTVAAVLSAPITVPGLLILSGAAGLVTTTTLAGKGLGETGGDAVPDEDAGDIITGAPTVFLGVPQARAARMSDLVKCHEGKAIADGSVSVFIERWNAARKTDGTHCDGKIQDGIETVLVGGDMIARSGTSERSQNPGWYDTMFTVIDWTGTILGFVETGATKLAVAAAGLIVKGYAASGLPGSQEVGQYGGLLVGAAGLVVNGRPLDLESYVSASATVVDSGNTTFGLFTAEPRRRSYDDPPQ